MSRARGARRPDGPRSAVRRGCSVWVMMLMYVTVGAKWSTDKIQFHGYSVIRFRTGNCCSSRCCAFVAVAAECPITGQVHLVGAYGQDQAGGGRHLVEAAGADAGVAPRGTRPCDIRSPSVCRALVGTPARNGRAAGRAALTRRLRFGQMRNER